MYCIQFSSNIAKIPQKRKDLKIQTNNKHIISIHWPRTNLENQNQKNRIQEIGSELGHIELGILQVNPILHASYAH